MHTMYVCMCVCVVIKTINDVLYMYLYLWKFSASKYVWCNFTVCSVKCDVRVGCMQIHVHVYVCVYMEARKSI